VGTGGHDQIVIVDLRLIATARGLDDDVSIVGVHPLGLPLDQMYMEPVIDRLKWETGPLGLHVPHAYPHQRGLVQKAAGTVDYRDLVVTAQGAAQV
jgi:hypothetical protein